MRAVTATEKYRAVNEGSLSKKEFVRQMRQQYPMYISQFNGYNDTVQILKNKAMLFEASKPAFAEAKVYDDRPALTYSLDALDRGIRIELGVLKLDPASASISREALDTATSKAKTNLEKDCNHYLNLMSGESNKVDKHDRDVEVKRGAKATDVFNGLKKATLKEDAAEKYEPHFMYKDGKKIKANTEKDHLDLKSKGYDHGPDEMVTPMSEDAKKQLLGKVVGALRTNYPDITAGILKDFIKTHGQDLLGGVDIQDEFEQYIDNNYEGPSDFADVKEMDSPRHADGTPKSNDEMTDDERENYYNDLDDVSEKQGAEEGIDMSSKDGYVSFIDNENILANYTPEDAEEMARELAMTHHDAGQDQDNFVRSFMAAYKEGGHDTHDQVHEKQGKDHDGDGDIDGDDYMAAKDKAIKKALKENVKAIISKILTETTINEAATAKLSDWGAGYESFEGVKPVVNELENIVTELESFYDRMNDKISKAFEKTNNFKNDEGLNIGAFIAPSLEAAFLQDLRPIRKNFLKGGIALPKVKTISSAEINQMKADGLAEEPKSNIFQPVTAVKR